MRIHGVHFQGLRIPPGEYRIDFDPGYNVVVAGRAADVVARVLCGLLFPADDLDAIAELVGAEPELPARAGLGIAFGPDAYRVVGDFRRGQIALARYDPTRGTQTRLALGAREVARTLVELGVPARGDFLCLHTCGGVAAWSAPTAHEDETLPLVAPIPLVVDPDEMEDRERLKLLRDARDRLSRVEEDLASAASALERMQPLAALADTFEERLQRHRQRIEVRDGELAGVESARRALLDDRAQLRLVPRTQRGGAWTGLVLGISGAVLATVMGPLLYGISVLGFGLALFMAAVRRSARRRLGRIEARLSGLRVRERSIHHTCDVETREITAVLEQLELDSIEDLQREVADYRGLMPRIERLQGELAEAQRAFPASARRELEQLDVLCAARRAAQGASPGVVAASATRATPDVSAPSLGDLIAAAVRASGKSEVEVRERMAPSLPLYLRALTEGRLAQIRRGVGLSWELRRDERDEYVPVEALSPEELDAVRMAVRLALLEGLAPTMRIPVWVGPGLWPATPARRGAIGRALRRLSSVVQVVHVAVERAEWDEHASSAQRLADPNAS